MPMTGWGARAALAMLGAAAALCAFAQGQPTRLAGKIEKVNGPTGAPQP